MPYAKNRLDGVQTYYEDLGGDGPTVVVYGGITQSIAQSHAWPLVVALKDTARLVLADHRGHGRSEKPHDAARYTAELKAADYAAVLDSLGLEKAHLLGYSWGGRLRFCVGEHQRERLSSLVLGGAHPYAFGLESDKIRTEALSAASESGMSAYIERIEERIGRSLGQTVRLEIYDNDPKALYAAWSAATMERQVSPDLSLWKLPCLVYMGELGEAFDDAKRAAAQIPGARLLPLPGLDHVSAMRSREEEVLPYVLETLHARTQGQATFGLTSHRGG